MLHNSRIWNFSTGIIYNCITLKVISGYVFLFKPQTAVLQPTKTIIEILINRTCVYNFIRKSFKLTSVFYEITTGTTLCPLQ